MRRHARVAAFAVSVISLTTLLPGSGAEAKVDRIIVDQRAAAFDGKPVGAAGPYERVSGRIVGSVAPADPRNAIIQDIALAPRDAAGAVEYTATFTILTPANRAASSGVMLYQVSNRGGRVEPTAANAVPGASYVWTGWQGDRLALGCITDYPCASLASPTDGKGEVLQVPVAHNSDGSTITGPVYGSVLNAAGSTAQLVIYTTPVPYRPASLDPTQAHFFKVTRQTVDGSVRERAEIASSDWAWADCRTTPFPGTPDPTRVCLKDGFDKDFEYDMSFVARDPLVLGLGFAATRDAVSFLRHELADGAGTANPLAGRISHAIAEGVSQSGNYLRSFLYFGFNQDETGHRVFDGLFPTIAGRQISMNFRFALPDVIQTIYMAGSEAPVWWADYADTARGREADGLLHSCSATGTCPRIFESFGSTEFWALKMSGDMVGSAAAADIPVPPNVRRYYFPGTKHGGGSGGFSMTAAPPAANGACAMPENTNPETEQNAALLRALIDWVVDGRAPPPSTYPTLAAGQLVAPTRQAMGFPEIPGADFADNLVNPLMELDFGPRFDAAHQTGIPSLAPPVIKRVFPTLVVRVDADGNEVAGEPSVQSMAPLGTYTGWNRWAAGGREGQICNLSGAMFPFPVTQADRVESHDPRASLEERYGSHDGYVCAVEAAARGSISRRFLRPVDATKLVAQAKASDVLQGVAASDADRNVAAAICRVTASIGGGL
jgi:hypothetical protein